ncbi:MAG: hydrogenase nickel incorporation protein HypA [Myxococcota bacterium]
MHEFALAQAVVDSALEVARREKLSRITRLVVGIGELQRIGIASFEFALSEVIPTGEPRLEGVTLALETEPARFRCRVCERDFGLDEAPHPSRREQSEAIHFVPELAHAFLRCPRCESPDFEIRAGRGVVLRTLEGE